MNNFMSTNRNIFLSTHDSDDHIILQARKWWQLLLKVKKEHVSPPPPFHFTINIFPLFRESCCLENDLCCQDFTEVKNVFKKYLKAFASITYAWQNCSMSSGDNCSLGR